MHNLKEKVSDFSLSLTQFLKSIDQGYISQSIGRQLLRSGTSVGANVVEAQAAPSKKDFAHFYKNALKSANEAKYWFFLLKNGDDRHRAATDQLEKEINKLTKIIERRLLTVRKK